MVITGVGALSPCGNSAESTWRGIRDGKSAAAPITRFDASLFKTRFACEVKGYDPKDYFHPRESKRLDLFTQFALIAAREATKDARLQKDETDNIDRSRTGVIWGTGIGGLTTFGQEARSYSEGQPPRYNPFFIPKMIVNMAGGLLAMEYGFRGVNLSTVSACSSANNALIESLNYIRYGKADLVLSGGSEATITQEGVGGFSAMKALSTRNEDPMTASRPFDKDRDGFVIGEGAACLVLEEYEHAKRRGANMYAELKGGAVSCDAYHMTAPQPEGLGAATVMNMALEDADLTKQDIDYVNAHGTSTMLGDKAEIQAIKSVFKEHAPHVNISSTKSVTGHLLGAAGAIEALACVYAIQQQIAPPTINHQIQDENLDNTLNYTFNKAQKRPVTHAMSNSFGFGGHNTSLIFSKMA